jgi:hypothetical protein
MPNPAIVQDVEARFRPLTTAEQDIAQALLDDAWAVLLATVPTIESRLDSGALSPDLARFVIVAMALRVLRNPNGIRQWSVDDYSETRDSALSTGSLYVSDDEAALLSGTAARRRGAFSVAPYQRPARAPGAERDAAELEYLRYGYGSYGYRP